MYAVTAASGQLGRLAIEALLETVPPEQIVAAVRDPAKGADLAARGIVVRAADYDHPQMLATAFRGVERLLFISNSDVSVRVAQHGAVVEAARVAGVGFVAYTSVLHADRMTLPLAEGHRWTEETLRTSGIEHAILRHAWFMENYTPEIPGALGHGVIQGAAGNGRVSAATRADLARGDVAVLTGEGHAGKTYEFAGDEAFTLAEFAAELTSQSGIEVEYRNMSEADYADALVDFGMPAWLAPVLAGASAAVARGELFDDSRTLSRIIGRPTTTMPEAITAVLRGR